jgi:hypothetical protein
MGRARNGQVPWLTDGTDGAVMLGIAVVALSRHKLRERGDRWLKLAM